MSEKRQARTSRRAALRALAIREAARRCGYCRTDLATVPGPTVTTLDGRGFCSRGCYDDWLAWTEHRRKWRAARARTREHDADRAIDAADLEARIVETREDADRTCPHGNPRGACDRCDIDGDLAFDAARERERR